MEFIETMCWHLLLRGNAYARIVFGRGGKIELEMLHPDKMKVEVTDKGTLAYTHTDGGKVTKYTQYDIVHVRGHSQDGILGVSPIQANKMGVIDRAETMEDFHTNTYKNGVKLSGILQSPVGSEVDEMEADRLTKSFQKAYGGPANPSKVVLLPSGVTFETVSMTMEDAQFIDGRKLTRSEIAGIFGVPPHMIGDLDKSSFSNIENMSLNYLIYTIRCWLVRIEQAFSKGLFSTEDQQKYNIEFLADDLLRGDTLSRATAQKMRVESGSKTPNEVRAQEKENPLDWGDYTVVPANFRTITSKEDLKNPAPAVPTTKTNTKDEAGGETP
jgi:HK97 family phage portal protein